MNSRDFARQVVEQLQQAGYQALWAGGCVRDQLLNRNPKDYDVATAATPDQVRDVFGRRRTITVGAQFGVITVLGPRSAGPVEVATFRRDLGYSDGRRPDAVEFTDARQDALRRDFTINGMFLDPVTDQVLDFVGGQADLEQRLIRAIGNPSERIHEDKLRMLRGIRFAATFGFEIEPHTLNAITEHAADITVVSAERIGAEMNRMLAHPGRKVAADWLRQTGLLDQVVSGQPTAVLEAAGWESLLARLGRLELDDFAAATVLLLGPLLDSEGVQELADRWRLSNDQRQAIDWIGRHWQQLETAHQRPWWEVQPLLIQPHVHQALAVAAAWVPDSAGVAFCRTRLAWPASRLDPPPLIGGQELIELGLRPGPEFKSILNQCRRQQLVGEIDTVEQARELVRKLAR